MKKNLAVRCISGSIYVALIVCAILFGGTWGFPALCSVFAILAVAEFGSLCRMGEARKSGILIIDTLGALILTLSPFLFFSLLPFTDPLFAMAVPFVAYILYFLARLIYQIYLSSDSHPLTCVTASLAAQLYIGLPLACASFIYLAGGEAITLTMFLMIWLNDTGAYAVGCSIGRHRLFPRISPKKSWEGFFGGVLFSVACALIVYYAFGNWRPALSLAALCGYGLIVSIFATWGDLVESMLKRAVGVKDSGSIMPGHGGILDRIDSLIFVAPVTVVYLFITLLL
ncbi:MAG: phosphatidate cytidylyltransferase [Paramuribaculum sp.]|nr:phosphatidate cytidylyltransferase [Paramuribaculum sp.]